MESNNIVVKPLTPWLLSKFFELKTHSTQGLTPLSMWQEERHHCCRALPFASPLGGVRLLSEA
jgi:hypothetical protein